MTRAEKADLSGFGDLSRSGIEIEKHRVADCVLTVQTPAGPVERGEVRVTIQRHGFMFGANAFGLGKMALVPEGDNPDQNGADAAVSGARVSGLPHEVAGKIADAAINRRVQQHGAEYEPQRATDDLVYSELFTRVFNLAVVPVYEGSLSPTPGMFRLCRPASIIRWARTHGLTVKGHPLIFHNRRLLPPWLTRIDEAAYWPWAERRIQTLLARFDCVVDIWDCVNEPLGHPPPGCLGSGSPSVQLCESTSPTWTADAEHQRLRSVQRAEDATLGRTPKTGIRCRSPSRCNWPPSPPRQTERCGRTPSPWAGRVQRVRAADPHHRDHVQD